MKAPRSYQNLVLAGFMGAGKSSVGRLVARLLRYKFIDTDALIEQHAGCSVADIFTRSGEATFRKLEQLVVGELGQYRHTVIATGGGMTANEANLRSLKKHALVVCLWATPDGIWKRVKNSPRRRPLLQTADPQARIRHLITVRAPYYRQADVLLHTEHRSTWQVAQQVLKAFRQVQSQTA